MKIWNFLRVSALVCVINSDAFADKIQNHVDDTKNFVYDVVDRENFCGCNMYSYIVQDDYWEVQEWENLWTALKYFYWFDDDIAIDKVIERVAALQKDEKIKAQLLRDVNKDGIVWDFIKPWDKIYFPPQEDLFHIRLVKGNCYMYVPPSKNYEDMGSITFDGRTSFFLGDNEIPSSGHKFCTYIADGRENFESFVMRAYDLPDGSSPYRYGVSIIHQPSNRDIKHILEQSSENGNPLPKGIRIEVKFFE